MYGAVAGGELFFSKLFSSFIQLRFLTGTMQNVFSTPEIFTPHPNGPDTYSFNFDIARKYLTLFEVNVGIRFYYGQHLGYTPFFWGFFEKN